MSLRSEPEPCDVRNPIIFNSADHFNLLRRACSRCCDLARNAACGIQNRAPRGLLFKYRRDRGATSSEVGYAAIKNQILCARTRTVARASAGACALVYAKSLASLDGAAGFDRGAV
jgi:hypothetical protein